MRSVLQGYLEIRRGVGWWRRTDVCYVMKGSKVKDVKHFVLECELGV